MGISVIGVYDYIEDRFRVFCKDNFAEFQRLVDARDLVAGFNSIAFDNAVCRANGILVPEEKSYDLLVQLWTAAGLGPKFIYPTHLGFGLDATASVNLGMQKSGHGALAPVQWQRGEVGAVIDYCLQDVNITRRLIDHARNSDLLDPRDPTQALEVETPDFIFPMAEPA